MIEGYIIHLLILIGVYIVLAVGLNLSIGFTGLLNLGHIAFFGIGAYTSAILQLAGVPFIISFFLAGVVASLFGLLLVVGTRNLKGDYFALATLGFSFVVYSVFLNWTQVTRGPLGIPGIPKPELFGLRIADNFSYLLFVTITVFFVVMFVWKLATSRYGKLLEAVRDDEIALRLLGKNTFKLKAQSMMVSAFCAGIAGSLFAHYITYIDPSSFFLSEIILVVTIVMIGGLASIRGSIFATVLILLIPEALRFVALPSSMIGPTRQIIYAVLLLCVLLLRPRGLFGKVDLE
ncbi:MAG TPA: branched-chain amino acid ABC transporter permease [Candidatus Andersenbacteria bacterium]|nr:branched-chain amino acid ABC transporter permease [Candidatus Andersenbacteria bacterium]